MGLICSLHLVVMVWGSTRVVVGASLVLNVGCKYLQEGQGAVASVSNC
jgi:hypothetical protein